MASVDYFLKIDGIDGEAQDAKHSNEIILESWSWGENQTGTSSHGTGMGAGKVQMQDFHFVMTENKASPKLFLACANGQHISKATLTCRKAGEEQQEFLTIVLSDILVSGFHTGGSGHGDVVPTNQISLNFSKIEYDYKAQDKGGKLGASVKAGWDLKKNQKV